MIDVTNSVATTVMASASSEGALLRVSDLRISIGKEPGSTEVVRGLSVTVSAGEILAIVGESGSGKSLTALSLMGLLPPNVGVRGGEAIFAGRDLLSLTDAQWQSVRGSEIGMIFQDPSSALNPCLTVGYQVAEMFRRHEKLRRSKARQRAIEVMSQVGIPDARNRFDHYPHQFSGGMRQRLMIAIALAISPRLLIADEPTTALDVTVQSQILRLLRSRRAGGELAQILISHDLSVVASTADTVAVMYAGRIVEYGPVARVYEHPSHPYTKALMGAVPARVSGDQRLDAIGGQPPDASNVPSGCAFHPRCPMAQDVCRVTRPELRQIAGGQWSACHFAERLLEFGSEPDVLDAEADHG